MTSTVRYAIALAALLAIGTAALWLYDKGGDNKAMDIERKDNKAGNRSDEDRSKYDLCPFGEWSFDRKRCNQ